MKIGIVGKPSSGKSTFFSAATMVDVPIAAYPFTTIKPNVAISAVQLKCPHVELGLKNCSGVAPSTSASKNCEGVRIAPVQLIDVAGLVPDAHLGKGRGNEFLTDLMDADALIHIVDLSGKTDANGNATLGHDPARDIEFLEKEIDYWLQGILEKNWKNIERKSKSGTELYESVYDQLSGLKIDKGRVKELVTSGYADLLDLATRIRKASKPIIIAGNKIDTLDGKNNYDRLKDRVMPLSADSELALMRAQKAGLIAYIRGHAFFMPLEKLNGKPEAIAALEQIKKSTLDVFKTTGMLELLHNVVFDVLEYIPVYPVEDENKFTDVKGRVLPDVKLMKKGSTALDLAFAVHTSIGEGFIGAIDARTKKRIGKDYVLKANDIIKIQKK